MEPQNYLGIYLSKDTATVVCIGPQGRDRNVLGCFSVSVEQQEQAKPQALAALIAQGCAERELKFSEVAVALDCAMFMQHNVHSEFDDPKQIAATVRFDTEEALAMDVTDVAIAFKIASSGQAGSELTVFTAQRKILSDILLSLQSNSIDPVTIEPDVNCLSRFICQNVSLPEELHPFFCMLSRRSGYFIVPREQFPTSSVVMRTFLLGSAQDRTELLAREVPVTTALVRSGEPVNCLKVSDSTGSVNYQRLSEKLGIEADAVDLAQCTAAGPDTLTDCADHVDFAIACGAALAHLEKMQSINFRNDFNPFQGKKVRLQKALKFLSVSVTVFVLAIGMYGSAQLLKTNGYRSELRGKFGKDYSAVTLGQKMPARNPEKKLAGLLRRIKDVKDGQSPMGEESISAKLTLVLGAFNKCTPQTRLNVESVSVTARSITITGDTANPADTRQLRKALISTKLGNLQENLQSTKTGRHSFSITVTPEK